MAKQLFSGLVVGGVAGTAAGLLLAPKSGRVTRRFARQRGAKYVEGVKEKVKGLIQKEAV